MTRTIIIGVLVLILSVLANSALPFLLPFVIGAITYLLHIWMWYQLIILYILFFSLLNVFGLLFLDEQIVKLIVYLQNKWVKIYKNNDSIYKKEPWVLSSLWDKLVAIIEKKSNLPLIYLAVIWCCWFMLPDLITTRVIKWKMSEWWFVFCFMVWKWLFYIPIVYWIHTTMNMM